MVDQEEPEYENLEEIVSFIGFDYNQWSLHEDILLRPRLESEGFYAIHFKNGEADSFGPLSRIVTCTDADGKHRKFWYG